MPDNKAKNPFAEFGGEVIKKQEKNAFSEFGGELVTPKKKEATALPSEEKAVSSSSATQGTEEQKPSVSSGSVKNNVFTGYPGKEGKQYQLKDGVWYEYSSTIPKEGGKNIDLYEKPITNVGRVDALNSFFKQKAYYNEQHKTETKLKDKIIEEQKALKGQGHNVDINGLMDDKTLIAKNKEQAKVVISEKEKARKEKVLTSIDAYINKGLIGNEEEQVVSFLRNKFGKDGFIFEESGAGDNLSISYNANGVTTKAGEISLDNWTTGGDIEEMNKLKSFMKNAYMTTSERKEVANASNVRDLVKLMGRNPLKYGKEVVSEDVFTNHIDKSYMTLSLEQKRLKDDYKQLDLDIQKYNENPSSEKLKEIQNRKSELSVREYAIVKEYGDIKNATRNYSKAVGTYAADKAKEGSFTGIIAGGLAQGLTNIEKMVAETAIDVIPYLSAPVDPMTEQKLKATGYTDAQIKDYAAKELKQRLLPKLKEGIQNVATVGTTTQEYVQSKDRNDIEKTANFLSESIGTALSAGGNPTLQKIAFFSQSYNAMEEQMMNGSDFEGLTENQKKLVSVPYGIVIGALEKLGFEIGTGQNAALNGMVNKVIARTFTELPKDASIQLIEKTLAQNAKTIIAQGVARVGVSALSEGFVEGVQNVAETGEKYLVNKIEGFDYFQNVPDITTSEGIKAALNEAKTDAYYGALGGLVMSGLSQSYNAAKNGFNEKQNDLKFEDWLDGISDDKLVQATKLDIKTKLANGDITKEQAQEQIEGLDKARALLNEIPAEYSVRDKRTSFNLIQEKKKLEKDIQGKDEASVFAQKERINAINEELKTISLNNATKESTEQQQEIPTESNISERQGTTEGQQEVGKGEGSERTAEKPEANISDSNIPSEETQVSVRAFGNTTGRNLLYEENYDDKYGEPVDPRMSGKDIENTFSESINDDGSKTIDVTIPMGDSFGRSGGMTIRIVAPKSVDVNASDVANAIFETNKVLKVDAKNGNVEQTTRILSEAGVKFIKEQSNKTKEAQVIDSFDDVKNANNENDLARLYNEEVGNLSNVNEKEKHIHSSISKVKKDSYVQFGDANNISQGMAKTYFRKDGLSIDQVAQEASQSLTGEFSSDAITPQDVVEYMNKYPNGFNPATPSGNPKLRAISEKYKEITGKQINSRIAKIKANNIGNESKVAAIDSKLTQAIQTAGLLKTLEDNINDEGFWTQFPGGFTKEEYEQIKKEYNETSREELDAIANPIESRVNWDTENDEISGGAIEQKQEETSFEEIKNLDVTDKTNLQKVQSFLDNALNDLDAFGKETLGMNLPVAVARVVLKTVKTLVDAGVSLEQAFKQAAQKHNVKEVDIADTLTALSNKKKETQASTAAKNISKKPVTKVTVNERTALKTQLKLEAKAAKNVDLEIRAKQKEVKAEIRDLVRKGIMNTSQASLILRKLASVNFLKQKSIDDFLVHYNKVMTNAEYAKKLSDAFKNRTKIKNTYKKNQATFRTIAENFLKINPLTVQNIDIYGDLADRVLNASKTTSIKKGEVSPKEAIEYNDAVYKIHKMIEHQEELIKQRLLEDYDYMVQSGAINSNMSLSDIREILKEGSEDEAKLREAEDAAKSFLNARLSALSFELDELKRTGTNPSELMQKVANVDMNLLNKNDIIALADAIDNFITNGVTDGVGSIMSRYEAKENINKAKRVVRSERVEYIAPVLNWVKNKVSKHKVISKREVLKWRLENFVTLPLLVERIFPGVNNASRFNRLSSISEISEGKTKAIKRVNNKQDEYFNKFNKAKMKSGRFFDASNVVFRGFYADLIRNAGKTELEQNKEFLMKVDNIRRSIETLSASSIEQDLLKAKLYQEVYDNINKDSYKSFISNPGDVDPVNVAAVNFGRDMFAEIYPDLEKVSLEYYNTQLNGEANYSSARYIKSTNQSIEAMDELDFRDDRMIDSKEVKTMKAAKVRPLNDGEYVDLTFDSNLFKSYRESLIAIETSAARMKMKEFFKDKNFKEIIADNQDRYLIQKASADFVNDTMGYTKDVDDKTMAKAMRWLSEYAAVRNLGSIFSVVKQSVPVALNTLVITGEMPLPLNPLKGVPKDQSDFLDRNGVSVGLRGGDSALAIKKANEYVGKLTENTASIKNKISHATEAIKEGSLKPMTFGDIVSNKLSWFAFYKQSLRDQGLDSKNIDWNTHEFNKEASDYATQMIDRSQNPSDFDMMAKFFKSKNQWANLTKSILLPYASFNVNAKKKIVSDINTLKSKVASPRDKTIAIRSLTGTFAEVASFNALGVAWRTFVVNAIAGALTGDDDDDETKKDLDRELTYFKKNMYSEYVSPSPVFNEAVLSASAWAYDEFIRGYQEDIDTENKSREEKGKDKMTIDEENKFVESIKLNDATHSAKAKDFFESFGAIGTIGKQVSDFYDLSKTAGNKSFIDKYGNNKNLSEQQINKLRYIQAVDGLSLLLGIPKDVKSVANAAEKKILFKTLTDAGVKRMHDVEEYMNRKITDNEYKLVSKISSVRHLLYVLEELEGNERAQNEAYKLSKEGVDVADYEVIEDLKKGRTAEQIKAK